MFLFPTKAWSLLTPLWLILEPVRLVDGRAAASCSLTTTSLLHSSQSQHPTRHLSQTAPVSFLRHGRGTSPCSFSGFRSVAHRNPRRLRRPTDEEPLISQRLRTEEDEDEGAAGRSSQLEIRLAGPPLFRPSWLAPMSERARAGPRFCDRLSITRTRQKEMLMRRTGSFGQDAHIQMSRPVAGSSEAVHATCDEQQELGRHIGQGSCFF